MVQKIFKVQRSDMYNTGWGLVYYENIIPLPECIYEELNGKYMSADDILDMIDTIQIALAGITDSLNIVEMYSFCHRSVLKTFALKDNLGTIDDEFDDFYTSIYDYEKYHIIEMDREIDHDDNSVYAYIYTYTDGRIKCSFDTSIRLYAKRNNIKYWVDDYTISTNDNGETYAIPSSTPIEIM